MTVSPSVDYVAMGERIRLRRQALGVTQGQLAKMMRVSGSYVGQLERAEKIPSVETLTRICTCMDMSLDDLVMGIRQPCDKAHCAMYTELRALLERYSSPASRT
jgi:transcriptional regulator with XRE-family HTH domain